MKAINITCLSYESMKSMLQIRFGKKLACAISEVRRFAGFISTSVSRKHFLTAYYISISVILPCGITSDSLNTRFFTTHPRYLTQEISLQLKCIIKQKSKPWHTQWEWAVLNLLKQSYICQMVSWKLHRNLPPLVWNVNYFKWNKYSHV